MNIWCIGDINYFVAVLNGLAMLSNSGLFNDLIKLGLVLGVLLITFNVLMQHSGGGGGGIPWGRFIVAFIVLKFLFGTATTVHVNDTYTLQAMDVDNVPYGVAFTGSMLSQVAHEITLSLEQAFSLPNMTDSGFAGPLQTLIQGNQFGAGLDTLYNGNITKTLVEYCDKCTSTGINLGALDLNTIQVSADPWGAMKYDSDIYYATTWLPTDPPTGTLQSCSNAWSAIDNYLKGQLWTDWNKFLSAQICTAGAGTCDPVSTVQSALDSLATTEQDARNYMLAAVLLPALEQGQINFNSFMGKPEMSIIVGQAREQRNIQWEAEGSLFMNIARPMMAFFEGFLYAITPFMALLVGIVPEGLRLVGKYIMMFIWVQLWMPIMAILNQYTEMVAQKKISMLIDGSIPLTSLQGHLMGVSALNDWLGTAGVLVASTPAISLALLFGGAITMTHLAGRLQHGEHIDAKLGAPDVVQPGAIMLMAPAMSHDPTLGARSTGAEGVLPRIEVSEIRSQQVASSAAQVATATQTFRESIGQMAAHSAMGSSALSQGVQSASGLETRSGSGFGSSSVLAQMAGHDLGLNQSETAKLSGNLSAGANVMGTGANITSGFDSGKGQQIQDWMKTHLDTSGNKTLQTSIDEKLASMANTGELRQYQNLFKSDDISNVEKSAQQVEQAQKQFSETQEEASRVGMVQSVSLLAYGKAGAMGGMGETFGKFLEGNQWWLPQGRVEEAASRYQNFNGVADGEQARWMGAATVMQRMSKYAGNDPGEKAKAEMAGKTLLGTLDKARVLAPDTGDASKNKGIVDTGHIDAAGKHAAQAAEGLQGPEEVRQHIQDIQGSIPGVQGPGAVRQWYQGEVAGIRAQQTEGMESGARHQYQKTIDDTSREFTGNRESMSQGFLQVAMGAVQGTFGSSAPQFVTAIRDGKLHPGSKEEVSQDYQRDWAAAGNKMLNLHYQAGKSLGLDDNLSKVYAGGAMHGWAIAAKERLGVDLPPPQQYAADRAKAIEARTAINQDRGYSPDQARQLAQNEVHLAELAGQTGMEGWASRITQGDKIFQQVRIGEFETSPVSGRRGHFDHIIDREAQNNGVDPDLIKAMIGAESGGNPGVTSPKGAMGLMQLMPGTASAMGVKNPYNAEENIRGGIKYMRQQLTRFGDARRALIAYNWGPENVMSGKRLPAETRAYVNQVLHHYNALKGHKGVKIM